MHHGMVASVDDQNATSYFFFNFYGRFKYNILFLNKRELHIKK